MSLRRDVIANYAGQVWAAAMGLAFVPLYVAALGLEQYALIGFFVVLQAWLAVLDLGVTPTLSREMARLNSLGGQSQAMRNMLRSLECLCIVIAIAMLLAVLGTAEFVATSWLKPQQISTTTVVQAIQAMAVVLSTRWVEQVYRGGLQGLGDFVWINVAHAGLATLRWAGGWVLVGPAQGSITAFFVWQSLVSVLALTLYIGRMYFKLPAAPRRGRFDADLLRGVGKFAGGMFAGSLLILALSQIDKLLVSTMLPLDDFGRYMLAATVAAGLLQLATPIVNAVQPRLTALVTRGNAGGLRNTYFSSAQWMVAFVMPPGLFLAIYAEPVLALWTGDASLAADVRPLLQLLAAGALCNALMSVPYALQLAHGWTGLSVRINAVAVLVVVPGIVLAVPRYGAVGAAAVWCLLNLGYVLIGAALMYRRLLPDMQRAWTIHAVAIPLITGCTAGVTVFLLRPNDPTEIWHVVWLAAAFFAIGAGTALGLPALRQALHRHVRGNSAQGIQSSDSSSHQ